jgi:hypothetical protein
MQPNTGERARGWLRRTRQSRWRDPNRRDRQVRLSRTPPPQWCPEALPSQGVAVQECHHGPNVDFDSRTPAEPQAGAGACRTGADDRGHAPSSPCGGAGALYGRAPAAAVAGPRRPCSFRLWRSSGVAGWQGSGGRRARRPMTTYVESSALVAVYVSSGFRRRRARPSAPRSKCRSRCCTSSGSKTPSRCSPAEARSPARNDAVHEDVEAQRLLLTQVEWDDVSVKAHESSTNWVDTPRGCSLEVSICFTLQGRFCSRRGRSSRQTIGSSPWRKATGLRTIDVRVDRGRR